MVSPVAGDLAITWLIGWYAVLAGATLLALGWRARQLQQVEAPGRARPLTT